jgi:hypothetical protein
MTLEKLQNLHQLLDEFYNSYLALPKDICESDAAWNARFAFDDVYDFVVTKENEQENK